MDSEVCAIWGVSHTDWVAVQSCVVFVCARHARGLALVARAVVYARRGPVAVRRAVSLAPLVVFGHHDEDVGRVLPPGRREEVDARSGVLECIAARAA